MKKTFKYILVILLMLPVFISATSFDNAVKLANDYYKNFDSFSLYFRTENNLPYEYDGSNKINSKFTSGGMLSKTEYDITVNGSKSYLFDGTKYWEIKGNIIDKTSSSVKTKVTEFTRNDVKVSGVGSFTNPWKFYDSYKVTIRSTGNGYIEQTGKLTYTKSVSAGSNIVFSIIGNNGYAYLSNDCGSYASYNEERNQLLISNVNKNIMCSVSFGVSNYSYSLPTVKYTISNPNSGVRECTFSNAVPQTFYAKYKQGYFKDSSLSEHLGHVNPPYRRGWTFKGYYIGENQLINSNGDFTTNYELINNTNANITFKATENTYKVTFDVTKYNTGSTTATIGTKNIDVTFDHDPNNITIPSKSGYTFEGYYLEGKFNGIGATTKYFDKDGKSVKYWDEDTNTTLYANWTAKTYTLSYNANGGTVSPTSKSITFDETYGDLPNPTRAGYVFQGWYKENTFVNKVESTTIYKTVGNSTIYAKWKECSKGHYCPGDNIENACAKGTYQDKTGQTSCIKCSVGTYNDLTGQTDPSACKACPAGSYCPNEGMSAPTTCSSGYYTNTGNNTGATTCTICAKGNSCNGKVQTPCAAGTYQGSTGKSSCDTCAAGNYTNTGNDTGATTCTTCPVGYYCNGKVKTECTAGNYTNTGNSTGASTCTACPAGNYCNGKVKTACPAGKYQANTGKSSCDTCASGKYTNTGNDTGATSCTDCPVGSYCNGKVKTACAKGKYQDSTGQSSCINCAAGSYSNGTGAAICTSCSAGTYQANTGQTSCNSCSVGTYQANTGASSCNNCPSGSTTAGTGNTSNTACYFSISAGYYNASTNSLNQQACPSGTSSSAHIAYVGSNDAGSCGANTYYISYNANGGSGNMSNTTCTYGSNCTLRINSFTRPDYDFLGWSTSSSATSATYSNGVNVSNLTITNGGTVTLYAVWESSIPYPKYTFQGSSFSWLVTCSSKCTSNSQCSVNHCCSAGVLKNGAEVYLVDTEGIFGLGYVQATSANFSSNGAGLENFMGATSCQPYGFQYGVYGGPIVPALGSDYAYIRFVYKTDEYGGGWQYFLKDSNGNYLP